MKKLNKQIWTSDNQMIPVIREKLLKIAKWATKKLSDMVEIKDVYFTGSLASFKWTDLSDVDLHIIVDIKEKICDEPIQEYLDLKSKLFNTEHDIFIKGYKVEVNIKNEETELKGKGIYDVKNNQWVVQPTPVTRTMESPEVLKIVKFFQKEIDKLISAKGSIDSVDNLKKKIKQLRTHGLNKEGEYSVGNLVFKKLRHTKYIEKLFNYKADRVDKSLSLENLQFNTVANSYIK